MASRRAVTASESSCASRRCKASAYRLDREHRRRSARRSAASNTASGMETATFTPRRITEYYHNSDGVSRGEGLAGKPQPHSLDLSPEARWTERSTAMRITGSSPTTVTVREALVTAVYRSSRVSRRELSDGSETTTSPNWEP